MSILDQYNMNFPAHSNAIDLFKNEWSSQLPGFDNSGVSALFNDHRIRLFEEHLDGGFKDKTVLELGPLEGGHTCMMSELGASKITSIEANQRAYMKCLVSKEIFGFKNTELLLGDFNKYIEPGQERHFDFALASGVIYHCVDPVKTLHDLSLCSDVIGIWSHYYDEDICRAIYGNRFDYRGSRSEAAGIDIVYHRLEYEEALDWDGFCGGAAPFTNWISKADWERLFAHLGFDFTILAGGNEHPNGPEFTAIARKQR